MVATTCDDHRAAALRRPRRRDAASWLAWRAVSALWRTVPVSCSIELAVCCRLLAACSVRALRSWLPLAISALAVRIDCRRTAHRPHRAAAAGCVMRAERAQQVADLVAARRLRRRRVRLPRGHVVGHVDGALQLADQPALHQPGQRPRASAGRRQRPAAPSSQRRLRGALAGRGASLGRAASHAGDHAAEVLRQRREASRRRPACAAMPVFGSTEDRSIAESACLRYLSICLAGRAPARVQRRRRRRLSPIAWPDCACRPPSWLRQRRLRKALTLASSSEPISATVR